MDPHTAPTLHHQCVSAHTTAGHPGSAQQRRAVYSSSYNQESPQDYTCELDARTGAPDSRSIPTFTEEPPGAWSQRAAQVGHGCGWGVVGLLGTRV